MIKQLLDQAWTLRPISNLSTVPAAIRGAIVPAIVPGSVHTDLMRAGLISDPYFGLNENALLWIGDTDWEYATRFDTDEKLFDQERVDLCFDGLDTVATIWLNGKEIAQTQNMHRRYRLDIKSQLRRGRNEIIVQFRSPVRYAKEMSEKVGFMPFIGYQGPFNFIRKMACNFGWDWGPMVATCGIWKPVRIEGWSGARIVDVLPVITRDGDAATVEMRVRTESTGTATPTLEGQLRGETGETFPADATRREGDTLVQTFKLPHARWWWPAGHGAQPRYEYAANVGGDSVAIKVGVRTVELDTSSDPVGAKMLIKVNGKPIFCKGYNWIPDDCFLERGCEPGRVRHRIQQAMDSNANMLRVWGGGIYETDDFYNICDELGMLVWQDFLFACATYPEVEPFYSEVEAEARDNVARLAHHPSLVLWNGCNENVWMIRNGTATADATGTVVPWERQVKDKAWGAGYYFDLLPKIVKEVDPSRPYWAASPWSGDTDVINGIHPNAETHGNKHIWEVWHGKGDYNNYREFTPRFCSEFGYQGPANHETMRRWFPAGELTPTSPSTMLHQKSPEGNARNERLLLKDFDVPTNFDDWHYLLQLNQARALTAGVEWFRSRQPVCMGTLYWQLNDCYPVTSWSAIDSDGRLKPLWYASRRFFADRLVTIQPDSDGLKTFVNNDSDNAWNGDLLLRRLDFSGKERASARIAINIAPRSNAGFVIPGEVSQPQQADSEVVVAEIGGERATWFFLPDRDLRYPAAKLSGTITRRDGVQVLTIASETLVRDLIISVDRVDPAARIADNVLTLLPGERRDVQIWSDRDLSAEVLLAPPVCQTVNRFGAGK